jgi:hypothetical protein
MTKVEDIGVKARVDELEDEVEDIGRRLATLENVVADIRALGENFWREEAAVLLIGAGVRRWCYDVRDRNIFFSDVFACEMVAENQAKRWVGRSGELVATVAINRAAPLVFTVAIDGFSARELANTLKLEIDGEHVPWSTRDKRFWSAIVPDRAGHARLDFRLSIDPGLVPAEKKVSFSFSKIEIVPLTADDIEGEPAPAVFEPPGESR